MDGDEDKQWLNAVTAEPSFSSFSIKATTQTNSCANFGPETPVVVVGPEMSWK